MSARIDYRPDVDGLRAAAVLSVVAYHVGLRGLPGGFVGVDCFFAISGFLIFSLLYQERQQSGTIDWTSFYARRVTRLLPEACVVIVAVLVCGYFVLLPIAPDAGDVRALPQHALADSSAAAAVWGANFYFALVGIGYFQPSVGREPLVHLWSLGVEEQFYLAVPLMFLLAGWISRATRRVWTQSAAALLALAFVVSLIVAVWWSATHPWSAYYMLPTRAYEFAVGAAAALWSRRSGARPLPVPMLTALAATGGVAVAASFLLFNRTLPIPGAWALVPTVGTTLLIVACGPGASNAIRTGLSLPAVAYLGKISYGWYLWHWPMLVFWREYRLYDVSMWSEWLVAAMAMIPAALGYHAVARLRRSSHASGHAPGRVLFFGAAGIAATLAACGALAWAARAGTATPKGELLNAQLKDHWSAAPECITPDLEGQPLPECPFGDPSGALTVVVWGDSHAMHWLPALDPLLKDLRMRGVLRMFAGCPAGLADARAAPDPFAHCPAFTAAAAADVIDRSRRGPTVVLLASRWAVYVNDRPYALIDRNSVSPGWAPGMAAIESSLAALVARLTAEGIPTAIAQQVPEQLYEIPICLYRMMPERCVAPWSEQMAYLRPAMDMVGRVASRHGAHVFDPLSLLCSQSDCPGALGRKALYVDEDHLSGEGARLLGEPLRRLVLTLDAAARP